MGREEAAEVVCTASLSPVLTALLIRGLVKSGWEGRRLSRGLRVGLGVGGVRPRSLGLHFGLVLWCPEGLPVSHGGGQMKLNPGL